MLKTILRRNLAWIAWGCLACAIVLLMFMLVSAYPEVWNAGEFCLKWGNCE